MIPKLPPSPSLSALKVTLAFLIFGAASVLLSDHAVDLLGLSVVETSLLQTGKGLLFVTLSALLVGLLARRTALQHQALAAHAQLQHERLQRLVDVSPAVLYALRLRADGGFDTDFISPQLLDMLGFSPESTPPDAAWWLQRVHPEDLPRVMAAHRGTLLREGCLQHEYRLRHAEDGYRWTLDQSVLVRDVDGQPAGVIGSWLDITGRKQAEEHARLIARVFEDSHQAICITDADTRIVTVNRAFTEVTGYTLDELAGRPPSLLKSGRQDAAFYAAMWRQLRRQGRWEGELWNRRKNGEVYPEWLTLSAIHDAQGQVRQYLGVFTDTTSRKAAEAHIERLAYYDALTALPNRSLLADRARVALATAQRQHGQVLLMHLNLDDFAAINGSLGLAAGDAVLREAATRLGRHLRPEDTLCRQGADDFLLLLPHTRASDAMSIGLRLMQALAAPLEVQGQPVTLAASIGVAEFPTDGEDLAQLSQAADSAVHQAKRAGGRTVRFFSRELQERSRETLALLQDLRQAVARQELVLHYQPQVDAATARLHGLEALLRWRHPVRGLVPPGEFITLAEQSGLIREIGTWVLGEALRQTAAWRAAGLAVVPVAVNLSAVQFRDPGLRDQLIGLLRDHGLPGHLLELELTETVAMEDSKHTIATLASLKQLGVRLSIDDFGTGYSSLGYLKRFAVDTLKVDQSFVRGLNYDRQDEAIVANIIALAHSLGLATLAEGVETAGQREFLRQHGCDQLQGWLFAKACPAEEVEAWLRQPDTALGPQIQLVA
ncbi:putative bifunctional diguanylate cyclase/phosphodiesterase [Ideonella livida]|uniref:EAL domain-containing protein n=1 Tax=Ideonella livida TaxID=2707176 RepID=A0A7C9PJX2_9BURK|nr:GGDEF domain-containing phosphodiesterase [Ideonella livida]NDY93768.1 EAL domain-containing protein [Ideonella livida]